MAKKTFREQRAEISSGKLQTGCSTNLSDTETAPITNLVDNGIATIDSKAPPASLEERLSRIEAILASLKGGSNSGSNMLQIDEQDKIQGSPAKVCGLRINLCQSEEEEFFIHDAS